MRSSHTLDRLDTCFDDERLVVDAGLLLPAALVQHLGLKDLVEHHLAQRTSASASRSANTDHSTV
ncbi:MAG: hypothetical protein ACP5VP_11005 [Candidatus Limnocylindrales bacterium]